MAALTQKQKNEMWSQERKNLMARVDRLRAAGVTVAIQIERPKKITAAHIAALKSVTKNRLLKGVNNKVLKVETTIPENVNRDSQGRIYATKEQKDYWKKINREVRERRALAKARAAEVAALPEIDYTNSDAIDKEISQTADDIYSSDSLEDYYEKEAIPENQRHLLHDIYSDETIFKEQALRDKYGDFYSELVAMLWRQKKTDMMSPEMIEYARKMARDKSELAEQLDEEKDKYYREQEDIKRWKQFQAGEVPDGDDATYDYGTLYIDYENGVKYSVDSNGEVTSEPLTAGQQPITYFRDVNTGTVYSSEDSRIYMRNSQGRLKYDANGQPLIKPNLAMINEQIMSREEYEALIMELMRSKYENISTEVGAIVLARMDEWQKKYSADEIRTAKEAAAADGYDISWSDIYEGDEERLALQLDVIENYLPNNNFFDRQAAIMKLAQYDDENENYEEPD